MIKTLTITTPDDWHTHLRAGSALKRTVPDLAQRFDRAIIMPNLTTPITTLALAKQYRQDILSHRPKHINFTPLMTLYLNDSVTKSDILNAKKDKLITACKLYPAGATTHSSAGVHKIKDIYPLIEAMQTIDLPLLIHGEVTDPNIDLFDRESVFIDTVLTTLMKDFPALRIVLEHISTRSAVQFVQNAPSTLAATITPHHLMINRNDLFSGGIHPHLYCLPIVKRQKDQESLIKAAISGHPRFFLGTDSAPHAKTKKEAACGCAGIYTSHAAIELYADIFDQQNALDKLENFSSHFGPQFYKLPSNTGTITLKKEPWTIPLTLDFNQEKLIPFMAGKTLNWQINND